jgi:hypothetical protein
MNKALLCGPVLIASLLCLVCLLPKRAAAVEALLLQDTCIDSNPTRGESPPAELNCGSAGDLRVFKGNGQIGRAFLKFSLETLPPDKAAADVIQARDHGGPG